MSLLPTLHIVLATFSLYVCPAIISFCLGGNDITLIDRKNIITYEFENFKDIQQTLY